VRQFGVQLFFKSLIHTKIKAAGALAQDTHALQQALLRGYHQKVCSI